MPYRISRNLEASIIDYLKIELDSEWTNINVEKTFAEIYGIELPSVCVRVGTTIHAKAEIGGDSTIRTPQILIDIFAKSDGMRLDIKDFIIKKMKSGCPYYDFVISNGQTQSKIANGRIQVIDIDDTGLNFDTDKDRLDVHDRFRHLLTLTVSLGRVEA